MGVPLGRAGTRACRFFRLWPQGFRVFWGFRWKLRPLATHGAQRRLRMHASCHMGGCGCWSGRSPAMQVLRNSSASMTIVHINSQAPVLSQLNRKHGEPCSRTRHSCPHAPSTWPMPPPPRCIEFIRLTSSKGKTVAIGNAKSASPVAVAVANKKDGFLAAVRAYEDYYKGKAVTKGGLQQLQFLWGVAICPAIKPVPKPVPTPVRGGAALESGPPSRRTRRALSARVDATRGPRLAESCLVSCCH